ncbi:hypothetical protein [Paludibacterium yongneupense]|nr:hypothetical protein [Paludibacterium yongneupense]
MSFSQLKQQEKALRLEFYEANYHGDKEALKAVLKKLEAVLFQQRTVQH